MRKLGPLTVIAAAVLALAGFFAVPAGAQAAPTCAGETVTLVAEPGIVTLGTDERDVILGTPGPDTIRGLGGDDVICGLGGDDTIAGNAGADHIDAGGGVDVVNGGVGDDTIIGSAGDDRLTGGGGSDILKGSKGADKLIGAKGDDHLHGGRGEDVLLGRAGDDTLLGGQQVDECRGGRGADVATSCNELDAPPLTFAVGDSIMVGAGRAFCNQLAHALPGVTEDSKVSRQFGHAQPIVEAARTVAPNAGVIVIALGTNGYVTSAAIDALLAIDPEYKFVFVNVRVPRPWEASVNAALNAGVARHSERAVLVDWNAIAAANPQFLAGDGIHLTCGGAAFYAQAIAQKVSAAAAL